MKPMITIMPRATAQCSTPSTQPASPTDLHPYGSPGELYRPPHAAQFAGYTADLLTEQSVDRPVPTARPDVHDQLLVIYPELQIPVAIKQSDHIFIGHSTVHQEA